ncbi:MAG: hypothetical protein QOE22_263 [Candidatus Parcubacteria bacterium]|jgi:hypothetical protein|nr:hypothetical protein [Candidatus Parcubacteria bacterium]
MASSRASQSFVPVEEVRSGVVILKSGGYRGIMMCSSINFALKSDDEQKAIIGGFQNFLNTIDFSVEIVVHSRKTDIRPYLSLLEERMGAQTSELMRVQLREYIGFIRNFIEGADIMTKTFYIVVPYDGKGGSKVASTLSFLGGTKKSEGGGTGDVSFDEGRIQLEQRMALVQGGLASSGLRAVPLGTEEIIELLYRSFNVGEMENPIRLTQ